MFFLIMEGKHCDTFLTQLNIFKRGRQVQLLASSKDRKMKLAAPVSLQASTPQHFSDLWKKQCSMLANTVFFDAACLNPG